MGRRHTKPVVDVEVVEVVPVAVGAARIPIIVVEGTAAQDPATIFGEPRRNCDITIIQPTWIQFFKKIPPYGGGDRKQKIRKQRFKRSQKRRGRRHTKTEADEEAVEVEPEAAGAARIPTIDAEGTAAQDPENIFSRCQILSSIPRIVGILIGWLIKILPP